MRFRKDSFFGKLLTAFFFGGFIPFLLLAFLFIIITRGVIEKTYSKRASEAVALSASVLETLLTETVNYAKQLAVEKAVIAYCDGTSRSASVISDVIRLIGTIPNNSGLTPYVIPLDGEPLLSRSTPPNEYRIASHGGWGILGTLARSAQTEWIVFAQPHPYSGISSSVAIGTHIHGEDGLAGYLIVDVNRKLIEEKIGQTVKSGGALTELVFFDKTGCIIYDMADLRQEASFYDPDSIQKKLYFFHGAPVTMGIEAWGFFPKKVIQEFIQRIVTAALAIASASAVIFFIVAVSMAKATSRPIHLLTQTMQNVSDGRLDVSCPEIAKAKDGDEVAALIKHFNQMISRVNGLMQNKVEQERNLRYAELKALQAQINPHFIYNTLNSIRSVARLKGDQKLAFISTSLARILREGSSSRSDFCTLKHSLELAKDFFTIEDWRWPGRFHLTEDIDPSLFNAQVPRLIVQPIIENALTHGLENKPGPGCLSIHATKQGEDLIIKIDDDGIGIDTGKLEEIRDNFKKTEYKAVDLSSSIYQKDSSGLRFFNESSGSGIGLLNTHRRLRLIYGERYGLTVSSLPGSGTTVIIRLPFKDTGGDAC